MHLNQDFEDLIHHLNAANVKYVVVGAYAVVIYAGPRYTRDIDFLVEPTPENAQKVYEALKAFGAPLDDLKVEDLCNPEMVYQIGIEPNRIDIIMNISGLSFEEVWRNKRVDQYGKEKIFLIDLNDLIQAKKMAGRPKDMEDVEKLLQVAKLTKKE